MWKHSDTQRERERSKPNEAYEHDHIREPFSGPTHSTRIERVKTQINKNKTKHPLYIHISRLIFPYFCIKLRLCCKMCVARAISIAHVYVRTNSHVAFILMWLIASYSAMPKKILKMCISIITKAVSDLLCV